LNIGLLIISLNVASVPFDAAMPPEIWPIPLIHQPCQNDYMV
jgi:hypothetical protein